jgi:hypothetical protein
MNVVGLVTFMGLLAMSAMLPLIKVASAQGLAEQSSPALIVTPSAGVVVSGPPGGPFSPSRIEYRLSASTGSLKYSIRTPSWLATSSRFGATDVAGITITLSLSSSAARLPPGTYGPGIAIANVSNGRGSALIPAKLVVQAPAASPLPAGGETTRGRGEYLMDDRGGYLLDDRAGRLSGQ